MKGFYSIIVLSLYFVVASCNHTSESKQKASDTLKTLTSSLSNEVEEVSIITLIANPSQYDGHKVRVIGYLNLEFEGNCIYFHKEDYDRDISKNGLWVDMSRDSTRVPHIKDCIKKYVLMEGTFATFQGHMGANSGSIKNITRLELWNKIFVSPPDPKRDTVSFPPPKAKP